MKVKAIAKTHFVHGNTPYAEGQPGEFTKAEAHDMEKSGLITVGDDVTEEDMLGNVKMDDAPANKMSDAPDNKMAEVPRNKSTAKK